MAPRTSRERRRRRAEVAASFSRVPPDAAATEVAGRTRTRATAVEAASPPTRAAAQRQPATWPSAVASGEPRTRAIELPAKTTAVARPARPGATRLAASGASIAQNAPWPRAQRIRAAITVP